MPDLTWEQKLQACQALGEVVLRMRKPEDWYVGHHYEKKTGALLDGGCVSNAHTPQEAVEAHWAWLTTLNPGEYIVVNAWRDDRQAVRWNGFMWESVAEEKVHA